MEGATQGETEVVLNRVTDLQAKLNSRMYSELAIDPYELEKRIRFVCPPWTNKLGDRARPRYNPAVPIGVRHTGQVRKYADPVWHGDGFEDQNRYL